MLAIARVRVVTDDVALPATIVPHLYRPQRYKLDFVGKLGAETLTQLAADEAHHLRGRTVVFVTFDPSGLAGLLICASRMALDLLSLDVVAQPSSCIRPLTLC